MKRATVRFLTVRVAQILRLNMKNIWFLIMISTGNLERIGYMQAAFPEHSGREDLIKSPFLFFDIRVQVMNSSHHYLWSVCANKSMSGSNNLRMTV